MMTVAKAGVKDVDSLRKALGEKHHVVRRYTPQVMDAVRAGLAGHEMLGKNPSRHALPEPRR